MLLGVLKAAYDSGIQESARRARAVAQQVFAYARDTHRATQNPARDLAGSSVLKKPDVVHFAAVSQDDVGPLLSKIEATGLEPVTSAALRLMLLTGMRDAALRAARWSEFDLEAGMWAVPGERMKSGRDYRTPLPKQAVAFLKALQPITKQGRGVQAVRCLDRAPNTPINRIPAGMSTRAAGTGTADRVTVPPLNPAA
jgi:integrase